MIIDPRVIKYINSINSIRLDMMPKDWFLIFRVGVPVTRTEVVLYFNENGFDTLLTGIRPGSFNVWVQKKDVRDVVKHYDQFMEWQEKWTSYQKEIQRKQNEMSVYR